MHILSAFRRVFLRPIRRDLDADPWLRYVLLLGFALSVFGIWARVPNFVGPDEYSRLIQPMKVAGQFLGDPGLDSLRAGLTDGRTLGATFYLYALVLAPIFLAVLLTGQLGQFLTLGGLTSRWTLWQKAPAWFWTSSVLLGRAVSVGLGLASVYLVYRIGVRARNRWTGRAAATGLAVTFGFVESAHTVNEDIPMLVFLLLTVLLALQYVDTGDRRPFWLSCLAGGAAIAFKLTGGAAVPVVGAAYVLRSRRVDDWQTALIRPTLLLGGVAIGAATIAVGFPSVLVGGPEQLLTRVSHTTGQKTTLPGGVVAGIEFWLLRGYLSAFGLPLFLGVVGGVAVAGLSGFDDRVGTDQLLLLAVPVATVLAVFATWRYVRVHHLLPTLPFLLLLAAVGADRVRDKRRRVLRVGLALLLVTSFAYAGVGDIRFTTDPREQATDWLHTNADETATVEVYENSIADVAAVHGRPISYYEYPENNATYDNTLVLNESAYTEWMTEMPDREPAYIQLTSNELQYVTPGHPAAKRYPERGEYIAGLLNGSYDYTVVATFGQREVATSTDERLLRAGTVPEPESRERVVIILARTDGQSSE